MTTLYEKINDEFIPVAEHISSSSFPQGAHLVIVKPGVTSRVYNIEPETAATQAVIETYMSEISGIIYDAVQARPRTPLTEQELNDYNELNEKTGGKLTVMTISSGRDVVKKINDFVANKVKESLNNPAIEQANENLKTIMRLSSK